MTNGGGFLREKCFCGGFHSVHRLTKVPKSPIKPRGFFGKNPPPRGFLKLNPPSLKGWGMGAPWGPHYPPPRGANTNLSMYVHNNIIWSQQPFCLKFNIFEVVFLQISNLIPNQSVRQGLEAHGLMPACDTLLEPRV